jgi:hypothetical protein
LLENVGIPAICEVICLKVPAGQSVHELPDVAEKVPAGQTWHMVSSSARKKVPGGQQTATPVGKQCRIRPVVHVPGHGTYTSGVPELYRVVTSASDIA